ncbi:lysophospholipid acyltransferase family protein [Larsenimonas rhizosphaerae]|uniref:Lysophospholipid acyltransferase family protein n=1 Tax=Larsenimonas rhizosphaerae TaxID=2944682 RepID=A0AA41ZMA6_9GAMM|nr:lysophospholipid acyltransferase family protein [Larsenimonas rhizosphaerae]MCM2130781.1 1-acyl-sn-glycerol-3-phosphate acyltransferase [Larsenimonas rhizosphaerae]MCX2523485.1 lysophospholipid acyltransferase family protein [Larsenimonas rhizosphaerae]
MQRWLKVLFFLLIVRPLIIFVIGLNVFHRERLPRRGPHVLVANHNSHLDTLVLMSLFPLRDLARVRPVAAADYFLANRWLAWFSTRVLDIIPIHRDGHVGRDLMADCHEALAAGDILILFPEGSRGIPETMQPLKKGIFHLLKESAEIPLTPVMLRGLGRALPKGEALLVPRNCDVAVGEQMHVDNDCAVFMSSLEAAFEALVEQCRASAWFDKW